MSENNSGQVTLQSFIGNLTINFSDGRMMQVSDEEGRDLARALNTYFAAKARAQGYRGQISHN